MPGASTVGDVLERRIFAHQIGALNDAHRAQLKSTFAARTGSMAMKPMSQAFLLGAVEYFSGRRIDHELDRNAEPLGERRSEFRRDADWLAVRPLSAPAPDCRNSSRRAACRSARDP